MADLFTTSAGIGISYTDTGRPEGPALVLLHGMGEGSASWDRIRPAFEAEHRVVDVTLRGHTPSDLPGKYSYQAMFEDVVELLEELALGPAAILGHSLGGMVAFMLAVERPDLVGRLLVEDIAPGPPPTLRPMPQRPDGPLPFDWEMLGQMRPQIAAGALPLLERLTEVQIPALLIGGGDTSHIVQDQLAVAADRMPHAELVTLGGGHQVHANLPEEFVATVTVWLGKH